MPRQVFTKPSEADGSPLLYRVERGNVMCKGHSTPWFYSGDYPTCERFMQAIHSGELSVYQVEVDNAPSVP